MAKLAPDLLVLTMQKSAETYIFIFNDGRQEEIKQVMARYASNPALGFNWYDAAFLAKRLNQAEKRF